MGGGFRFTVKKRTGGIIFVCFALVFLGMGLFAGIFSIRERIAYNNSGEYKTVTADLVSARRRTDSNNEEYYDCKWEYKVDNESFYYYTKPSQKPASKMDLTLYRDAEGRFRVMTKDNISLIIVGFLITAVGAALLLWGLGVRIERRN